jgi:hypothetical protein
VGEHLLVRLLYGVGPGDPLTLPGVIAVIAGVTSISPTSRRAARLASIRQTVLRGD